MARVNVYFPDALIERARAAELNVSELAQAAVRRELDGQDLSSWLATALAVPSIDVPAERVHEALDAARDDLGW